MNVLIESFGNWTNVNSGALGKWSVSTLGIATANVVSNAGRRGGPALVIVNPSAAANSLLKNVAPQTNGTIGGAFKLSTTPSFSPLGLMWVGNNTPTSAILAVRINTSGLFEVVVGGDYSHSANGTVLATSLATFAANTFQYVELNFGISNSSTGFINLSLNNTAIITLTNVNTAIGTNSYSNFQIGTITYGVGTVNINVTIADVYLNNSSGSFNTGIWGDTSIDCFHPNGNTATTNFTPLAANNWFEVSETEQDGDASYNLDANPGDIDLFTKPVSNTNVGAIKVVQVMSVAKTDVSGPRVHANVLKSGATTTVGANNSLGTNYLQYLDTFEVDPNTGVPWIKANFDSANIGYKVIS